MAASETNEQLVFDLRTLRLIIGALAFPKLHPSFTLTEGRLRELQAFVPEAFVDGRIKVNS